MHIRHQLLQVFFYVLWKTALYVIRDFFSKLAMTITDTKVVQSRLVEQIRSQYEGVLVSLVRIVWDVPHSCSECEFSHHVLHLSEELLYLLTHRYSLSALLY